MVICLEQGADLHIAQLMPLPLTVSCFSKIQIGFTFLIPAHLGSPGKRAVKQEFVCVTCQIVACVALLYSLHQVHNELVSKLRQAALMTSALESQIKRYGTSF